MLINYCAKQNECNRLFRQIFIEFIQSNLFMCFISFIHLFVQTLYVDLENETLPNMIIVYYLNANAYSQRFYSHSQLYVVTTNCLLHQLLAGFAESAQFKKNISKFDLKIWNVHLIHLSHSIKWNVQLCKSENCLC